MYWAGLRVDVRSWGGARIVENWERLKMRWEKNWEDPRQHRNAATPMGETCPSLLQYNIYFLLEVCHWPCAGFTCMILYVLQWNFRPHATCELHILDFASLPLIREPDLLQVICCRQGQPFCCLRWSDSEITDVWLPFSARNFVWILHGLTRDNRFNRYSNKHDGLPLTLWGPLLKSASPEQDPLPCRQLPSQNDRCNMNPSKNLLPQNLSGFQDGLNLLQATTSPKLSTRIEITWPCHAMAHSHGWCHMVLLMLHVSSWWKSSFGLGGLWWAAFRLHGYILHDFWWFPKSAIKMVDNLKMHKPSNRLSRQQTPNNVKEDASRKKQWQEPLQDLRTRPPTVPRKIYEQHEHEQDPETSTS